MKRKRYRHMILLLLGLALAAAPFAGCSQSQNDSPPITPAPEQAGTVVITGSTNQRR